MSYVVPVMYRGRYCYHYHDIEHKYIVDVLQPESDFEMNIHPDMTSVVLDIIHTVPNAWRLE